MTTHFAAITRKIRSLPVKVRQGLDELRDIDQVIFSCGLNDICGDCQFLISP